ncbi:MAG TPA: SRPBCC family protein [Polyangiales bacterium]|nr:SRPBCC family protein [Polyangiales bacterium]
MHLDAKLELTVPYSPEQVFDLVGDHRNFPRTIAKTLLVPGVVRSEPLPGSAESGVGSRRRLNLTDGTTMDEEVTAFERPVEHSYRWLKPPPMPIALIVRSAQGSWRFAPDGQGTRIHWTYRFELSSPLALPLALPLVAAFRSWMGKSADCVQALLKERA